LKPGVPHADPEHTIRRGTCWPITVSATANRDPGRESANGQRLAARDQADGHRLIAVIDARGQLSLISRNGFDRTPLFRAPFRKLAAAGRELVLDGEIAVPDERGVTHLDLLNDAIGGRQPDRLAYFAFDLLHIDGHDLRRCPIEERKALLRELLAESNCERIVYVEHIIGHGQQLFERVRDIGAEGIVSKRLRSPYCGRESRDWVKTKCHEIGQFVITGYQELGEGRLEAVYVAQEQHGKLLPAGQVRFGFAGKGLWSGLDKLRDGPPRKGVVPVKRALGAEVKFFGRHKGGAIRDGVILSVHDARHASSANVVHALQWGCDCDEVIAAFDADAASAKAAAGPARTP
jgi:bifunctional non-homologous end joining protein LigD